PFVGNYSNCDTPLSGETLFRIQSDVIRQVAERESCIFVGRCADYILRENPRAVNIFLTANLKDRIHRIASRTGCTEQEAEAKIESMDRQRARYYNYYTSRTWGEASTYDLTINTSILGEEATAQLIIDFVNQKLNRKR
ncbi:MAG: cytidylate kinase-like family protein, partial [Alistipes sp.]|nr:cytidylate kinase-like family protein [Alistipes sp.]